MSFQKIAASAAIDEAVSALRHFCQLRLSPVLVQEQTELLMLCENVITSANISSLISQSPTYLPSVADTSLMTPETEPFPELIMIERIERRTKGDGAAELGDAIVELRKAVAELKLRATESFNEPEVAVAALTHCLMAEAELGEISSLSYARRSEALLSAGRINAAYRDACEACRINPDSARALKARGTCLRYMGRYVEANICLAEAQSLDFSEDVTKMLAEIRPLVNVIKEKNAGKWRLEKKADAAKRSEQDQDDNEYYWSGNSDEEKEERCKREDITSSSTRQNHAGDALDADSYSLLKEELEPEWMRKEEEGFEPQWTGLASE